MLHSNYGPLSMTIFSSVKGVATSSTSTLPKIPKKYHSAPSLKPRVSAGQKLRASIVQQESTLSSSQNLNFTSVQRHVFCTVFRITTRS